jgi:phage N-6-adenine-methyltransferase
MSVATRVMPQQKPGKSVQDFATPREFIAAVERRFGPIRWDLAAHAGNFVVPNYYGPGSPHGEDALAQDWARHGGVLWLNPPFARIDPWAEKAAAEGAKGARVVMLMPAAVGSNWFADHIHHKALVLAIRPRLSFDGQNPYPKDLICACYGPWIAPGFDCWRWNGRP